MMHFCFLKSELICAAMGWLSLVLSTVGVEKI